MFDGITPGDWGQIAVGLAAMIVAVVYSKRQIDKRRIVCQIKATPVIQIDGVASDDIEIRFKGTPVKTLSLYSISLLNLGNRPILRDDWDENLKFSFPAGVQVVDYRVGASMPKYLSLCFSSHDDGGTREISFEPFLLNAKEGFRTDVVVAGDAAPMISARIVGVSKIEILGIDGRNWVRSVLMLVVLSCIFGALSYFNNFYKDLFFGISSQNIAFVVAIIFGVWASFYGRKFPTPLYIDEDFLERHD